MSDSQRQRPIAAVTVVVLGALLVVGVLLSSPALRTSPYVPRAGWVGPKAYYLALGDSLAFGFQPDFNWDHGYVQDLYANLRQHGGRNLTNYGCNTESSVTMINGGCRFADLLHNHYSGPQLNAAIAFLHEHVGEVSPVTLDMGANDVIPDIDVATCTVSDQWTNHLATLDKNLRDTVLPQLVGALTNAQGRRAGDLVMTNPLNPMPRTAQHPQSTSCS